MNMNITIELTGITPLADAINNRNQFLRAVGSGPHQDE